MTQIYFINGTKAKQIDEETKKYNYAFAVRYLSEIRVNTSKFIIKDEKRTRNTAYDGLDYCWVYSRQEGEPSKKREQHGRNNLGSHRP